MARVKREGNYDYIYHIFQKNNLLRIKTMNFQEKRLNE